jgi:hypothetical protein
LQGPSSDIARAKFSPVNGFIRFDVRKTLLQRFSQNPNFRHFSNLQDAEPLGSKYEKSPPSIRKKPGGRKATPSYAKNQ